MESEIKLKFTQLLQLQMKAPTPDKTLRRHLPTFLFIIPNGYKFLSIYSGHEHDCTSVQFTLIVFEPIYSAIKRAVKILGLR